MHQRHVNDEIHTVLDDKKCAFSPQALYVELSFGSVYPYVETSCPIWIPIDRILRVAIRVQTQLAIPVQCFMGKRVKRSRLSTL